MRTGKEKPSVPPAGGADVRTRPLEAKGSLRDLRGCAVANMGRTLKMVRGWVGVMRIAAGGGENTRDRIPGARVLCRVVPSV